MSLQVIEELKAFQAKFEAKQGKVDDELKGLEEAISKMEAAMLAPGGGGYRATTETKSLGQRATEGADVKQFVQAQRGRMMIPVGGFFEEKALLSGTLVATERDQIIVPKPQRALRIRDLLRSRPTDSNKVDYLKESGFTNMASPQVEGSAKSESDITIVTATMDIRTIAHWTTASRQALDDISGLQTFIDQKMHYGLKLKEEDQLLAGSGTGQNLNGIITQATAYSTSYNVSGDTRLDKIRHAILQAEMANAEMDGIVLNPTDWHHIDLIKTEDGGANKGSYVVGDPLGGVLRVPTLWGKAVVRSTAISAGYFLVGAFSTAAEIRDRMVSTIDVSYEHSDYFAKNLVAIRAEERLCVTVNTPEAFIYGAF